MQYAQCLWGPRRLVLNVDRDSGENPSLQLISNDTDETLTLRIYNDVHTENMQSQSNEGAKKRMDIHIKMQHIPSILEVLEPFVDSLNVTFDEAPRTSPDPTGMEHPNGLPLGNTSPITWVKALTIANFVSEGFSVKTRPDEKLYMDAENYSRGARVHFGIRNINEDGNTTGDDDNFLIILKYSQLRRFLQAIRVAYRWLNPST